MPKIDPTLDPIIVAALMDDDDDEEGQELTKQFLETHSDAEDEEDGEDEADTEEEDADEADAAPTVADQTSDDAEEDAEDKPASTDVEEDQGDSATEEEKLSRREKREQRRREYLERVVTAPGKPQQQPAGEPYKPLDLKDGEYEAEDLLKDREAYAKAQAEAAVRQHAEQVRVETFLKETEDRTNALVKEPKFAFLDDANPDTFDAKKAENLNGLYMKAIGFTYEPIVNEQGYQKVDADGNIVYRASVARTDLPFDEFVRGYIENVEEFIDEREAEVTKNLVKQQAHQGVRPGGASRHGIGKLRPGDISKMDDDEFEKHEAEIDRQIAAELGI